MSIASYIKDRQPLVSKSFGYALSHDQLAHAYLLTGEAGTPLKETAVYLAKSILCDHPNPLADEECVLCQRIERGEYPDYVFLSGEEETIHKEDVRDTINLFMRTPLERKGGMVYGIHLVENMTPEAVNSLLKFLEEPNDYTYAILTTQNEEKVLPTIISRCEKLRLILTPRNEVLEEALGLGVAKEDAEILSFFHNDPSLLQAAAAEEGYQKMKIALTDALDALVRSRNYAYYVFEHDVTPLLNTKASARFFFDLLALFFRDIISCKRGHPIVLTSYAKIIDEAAKKLPHLEDSLLSVMTLRGEIELNIRVGLILTHLANILTKE